METWTHDGLASLIGGTYALTLGAYIFSWLGLSRVTDKIDTVRDNHLQHLEQKLEALTARVSQNEKSISTLRESD